MGVPGGGGNGVGVRVKAVRVGVGPPGWGRNFVFFFLPTFFQTVQSLQVVGGLVLVVWAFLISTNRSKTHQFGVLWTSCEALAAAGV